jgi:hypothetical protein
VPSPRHLTAAAVFFVAALSAVTAYGQSPMPASELQYRIAGKSLRLIDVHASVVLGRLPHAPVARTIQQW